MENLHQSQTLSRLYNAITEIYDSKDEDTPKETFEQKTIKLIKEQQDLGKITIKDSTDMLAKRAGIKSINKKIDDKILTSALYDLKRLRRLALKEKIERPLKLKSPLKEKELNKNSSPKKLKKLIKQKQ
ncbi:MAG: hypothetical protein IJZ30_03435 [Alphaproteobacteria bacterium]|nr:hypothetical protein [Alphaproteobacteria bacterium]